MGNSAIQHASHVPHVPFAPHAPHTVRDKPRHDGSRDRQNHFLPTFYSLWSGLCVLREAPAWGTAIALFRPVPKSLTGVASTTGAGVGTLFSLVEIVYTCRLVSGQRTKYNKTRDALARTRSASIRVASNIKLWQAALADGTDDPLAMQTPASARARRIIDADLRDAVEYGRRALKWSRRSKDFQAGVLTFWRDAVLQATGAGTAFAAIAKSIFHGAQVNMAVVPVAGSAIGIAYGVGHIASGVHARCEATSTQKACNAVIARTSADRASIEACRTNADALATFLARPGTGKTGLAFGKAPVCATEVDESEEETSAAQPLISKETTVPVPVPVPETKRDRGVRYDEHARNASTASLAKGTTLIVACLARMKVNEQIACAEATFAKRVATARIVYGAVGVVTNAIALALHATGVGTLAGTLISVITPVIQITAGAAWAAFAVYRLRRSPDKLLAVASGTNTTDAAATDGSEANSTVNGADAIPNAATDDAMIEEIMALLQDRSPATTLARKALKATLREHGVSRLSLQLMKLGNAREEGMLTNAALGKDAVNAVRAEVRNLIVGDTARTAVAENRVVERGPAAAATCSITLSA